MSSRQFHLFLSLVMGSHSWSTLAARKFICGKSKVVILFQKNSRGTSKKSL
uniref:Uncharacterized protein n=1 Tax=Arundo donax TaxID=35708 RepID=A0A0A9GAB5_ARUDO